MTEDWLRAVAQDWQQARLSPADIALCAYAERLTRTPGEMRESDVQELRACGFSDREIHDAVQVIAFFNYINRIADAIHVDLEPEMSPYPQQT